MCWWDVDVLENKPFPTPAFKYEWSAIPQTTSRQGVFYFMRDHVISNPRSEPRGFGGVPKGKHQQLEDIHNGARLAPWRYH